MASEMSAKLDPELLAQIDGLRDSEIRQVAPDEIVRVVQKIIDGMNSDIPSLELAVRTDLEALADYIQVTKSDIMSIDPEGIPDEHLPVATVELDAIVRATEEATNTIMESAEQIEQIASTMDNENNEALINATTRIFEACGFQDITGQRISKVVGALQEIENKIESLLEIFGDNDPQAREDRRRKRADQRAAAKHRPPGEMDDRDLLQGPQLPKDAIGQDDIDALFTSMDYGPVDKGWNMLRAARRDPTLILILSLYLLLLAFFILLNNISEVEKARSKAVAGSLQATFAFRGRPTSNPTVSISTISKVLGDDSLDRRLGTLVRAELRLARFEVIEPGRLMQLRVHEAALFTGLDNEISSTGRRLIDKIATELRNPPPGVRYDVEIRLSRMRAGARTPARARTRAGGDGLLNRIRRAAALSQALAEAKGWPGTIAGGVEHSGSAEARFLFEIRPEPQRPLFEDWAGG